MIDVNLVIDAAEAAGIELNCDITSAQNQRLTFEDLGLDSLDIFNLFLELENITGKGIPDDELDGFQTIADILEKY